MVTGRLIVDYTRAGPGMVTSRHALALLEFIESCGGAPEGALALLFRQSRLLTAKLRGAGMIYRVRAGKTALWLPVHIPPPSNVDLFLRRAAVGWLAARLKESGGRYEKGNAVFPSGAVFPVELIPPAPPGPCLAVVMKSERVFLQRGSVWLLWEDLRDKGIRECLKSV